MVQVETRSARGVDANDDDMDAAKTPKEKTVLLEVENKQLHHVMVHELYNKNPRPKRLTHTSVVISVVHISQTSLPWSNMSFCFDYNTPLTIAKQYSGFTNVMTNIRVWESTG